MPRYCDRQYTKCWVSQTQSLIGLIVVLVMAILKISTIAKADSYIIMIIMIIGLRLPEKNPTIPRQNRTWVAVMLSSTEEFRSNKIIQSKSQLHDSQHHIAHIFSELMSHSSSSSIPRSLELLNHRLSCPAKIRLYTTQEVHDDPVLVCALQALPHSEQQGGHVCANLSFRSP